MVEATEHDLENYEMDVEDAGRLLEPGYLPFESGYRKLSSGRIHVAALTPLPGSDPGMVDWWFGWVKNTERYRMWHPGDHVYGEWKDREDPDSYVGATHVVHEYIGGQLTKLNLSFVEPMEYFDTDLQETDATAICARGGPIAVDADLFTVIHFVRDTDHGCEIRSHFWLEPPADYTIARGVHQHCVEEMNNLAGFLPQLYASQNPDE